MAQINLKRNIMVSGSFRIVNMVIILLTSWLSTRYLGVELKGQYSYLVTLAGFIWIVLDMGIHKTYPYLLRMEPESQNQLFTWTYTLFFIILLGLGGLGMMFLPWLSGLLSFPMSIFGWWVFVFLIAFYQLSAHLQMLYLGKDLVKANSILQMVYQFLLILFIGFAFIFLGGQNRLYMVLLSIITASLFITGAYSRSWLGSFDLRCLNPGFLWKSYKMGIWVFLSTLFITLLLRADIVILKRLTDYSSVGIYSLAAHIVDMIQLASNLVGSLLLVKLADTRDEVVRWVLMKRIFMLFFVILGVVNIGFYLLGKPFIRIVYGVDFSASYYSYLWLIPASFGLSFGSLFNTYLWSKGFPLVSTIVPLIALIINIALNFLLIPMMGIAGAALA
ncbi:MAG: oligosaccharide flippase family protein, partial [Candidatus Cloacimonadaceae bacterium]|nr:oligosaccharide flippase family protein [Candidatus Cloacimonadaceae bacterium]